MSRSVTVSLGPASCLTRQYSEEAVPLGTLHFEHIRNQELSSFEYADSWLKKATDWLFDPDISFFAGRQHPPKDKVTFGMISDSCPDRWGRTLLQRHESRKAAREQRPVRHLYESDYLLGVSDVSRTGALRFSGAEDADTHQVFLASSQENPVPPLAKLRTLEHAAFSLENEDATPEQLDADLSLLLTPGSSLGGARPKASVVDPNGDLWIAKFPSKSDSFDTGLAEYLTYDLAKAFEINVTEARVEALSNRGHTFLIKRFDRKGSTRIHFASAMNLLGKKDGDGGVAGVSYLDVLSLIREQGASPKEDQLELFKRVLFSIAVSNTDDHLRNHGFLLSDKGWHLSPLYDVNPNPQGRGLSLNISEYDNTLSFELALSQASYYGLTENKAQALIHDLETLMTSWEQRARKLKMSKTSIEILRPAFCC